MKRSIEAAYGGIATTASSSRQKREHKHRKRSGSHSHHHHHRNPNDEQEDTATPEGKLMAQAMSTFTPSEHARFEAFRRSTLRGDAVSRYVASCLVENSKRLYWQREGMRSILGAKGLGVEVESSNSSSSRYRRNNSIDTGEENSPEDSISMALRTNPNDIINRGKNPHRQVTLDSQVNTQEEKKETENVQIVPNLADLVAPNASQEITIIVSALAKAYAERLVQSARAVAIAEGYSNEAKLLPHHLKEAHRQRVQAGIDPGFFMYSPASIGNLGSIVCGKTPSSAAAVGVVDKNKLKFQAVLAAQERYDQFVNSNTDESENITDEKT